MPFVPISLCHLYRFHCAICTDSIVPFVPIPLCHLYRMCHSTVYQLRKRLRLNTASSPLKITHEYWSASFRVALQAMKFLQIPHNATHKHNPGLRRPDCKYKRSKMSTESAPSTVRQSRSDCTIHSITKRMKIGCIGTILKMRWTENITVTLIQEARLYRNQLLRYSLD